MDQDRFLQGVVILCVLGGGVLIWHAIQNPICAGFGGGCAPDIAYLAPGVGTVLLGVGLLVFSYRHRLPGLA